MVTLQIYIVPIIKKNLSFRALSYREHFMEQLIIGGQDLKYNNININDI